MYYVILGHHRVATPVLVHLRAEGDEVSGLRVWRAREIDRERERDREIEREKEI